MNQILTFFRAEGPQAKRLIRLCRTTRRAQLFELPDVWREQARSSTGLTAYVEYMDGWLMGNDFARVMSGGTTRRCTPSGEVYFCLVTPGMLAGLRRRTNLSCSRQMRSLS